MAVIQAYCAKCKTETFQVYSYEYGQSFCDACGHETTDDTDQDEETN